MTGIEKLNDIEAKSKRIRELREQANSLIEQHIPQIWKDGDVRYLSPLIYDRIQTVMEKLRDAEDLFFVKHTDRTFPMQLCYYGTFGTLFIRRAE